MNELISSSFFFDHFVVVRLSIRLSYGLRSLVDRRDILHTLNLLANISHELACDTYYNPLVDKE